MENIQLGFELLALLMLTGIVAGFLDTLAGGGGLITVPALMLTGITPLSALATNKLQGSVGTATSTLMMLKKKKILFKDVKQAMLFAFIGSAIGTIAVHYINTDVLEFIIPMILIFIALYFLFMPSFRKKVVAGDALQNNHWSEKKYNIVVVPTVGFYDGMFGPGTGSFFNLTGVALRGMDIIQSTAVAKSLNFATNIASLFIFLFSGNIVWIFGICMLIGQIIGAWLGSHCLLSIKPNYLRILVVVMSSSMLVRYAHQSGWF